MWLKKAQGGCTLADKYTWTNDDDVVEVADDFAQKLLLIGHAGFTEVPAPVESVKEVIRPASKTRRISE